MQYPTTQAAGGPTPNNRCMVCDVCQQVSWHGYGYPSVVIHQCRGLARGNRMRPATNLEQALAMQALRSNT